MERRIEMILEKNTLLAINGGGITASMVNAVRQVFQFIFDLGKSIGSSISRMVSGNYC